MKYLLTIYGDESQQPASEDEGKAIMDAYFAFGQELTEAGGMLGGEGLQPTSTATTVRVREGERMLTDGPFAETKEQLGGFYLIEAKDHDEAVEWAAKIPGASTGCVEVRPVMDYSQYEQQHQQGAGATAS
jgi:hypothetical protein